mmetsp:Transcript_14697/g.37194  ORF Transcript_14697/g.37194 Transcript_14697/m.37194 type:complete len:257 (+) Transcript_14697:166-936(+)
MQPEVAGIHRAIWFHPKLGRLGTGVHCKVFAHLIARDTRVLGLARVVVLPLPHIHERFHVSTSLGLHPLRIENPLQFNVLLFELRDGLNGQLQNGVLVCPRELSRLQKKGKFTVSFVQRFPAPLFPHGFVLCFDLLCANSHLPGDGPAPLLGPNLPFTHVKVSFLSALKGSLGSVFGYLVGAALATPFGSRTHTPPPRRRRKKPKKRASGFPAFFFPSPPAASLLPSPPATPPSSLPPRPSVPRVRPSRSARHLQL